MSVFKDNWNGYGGKKWRVSLRYTDWQGKKRSHDKRGFNTKKEALEYERQFIAKKSKDLNMGFEQFIEIYLEDLKPRIKATTYVTKAYIFKAHIKSYFKEKSVSEISAMDILQWQNVLLSKRDENGKGYAPTYLRTINNQLTAALNHAVLFYGLKENPCKKNKKMGKSKSKEMLYWTKDEYTLFAEAIKDKPMSYYAFQILFWTGARLSELLALDRGDIDLEKRTLNINKQLQRVDGENVITTPKSDKSSRVIDLPEFLCKELEDYFEMFYRIEADTRLFHISKSGLHHEMSRGAKLAEVKRIRIHDLRHSSVAALIALGFSLVQIAERLGHDSATITKRYAHLYPSIQKDMADKLNTMFLEGKPLEIDNDEEYMTDGLDLEDEELNDINFDDELDDDFDDEEEEEEEDE